MEQWNEIFKKRGRVFFKEQENMENILKIFREHGVKRILDLGCGTGRHVIYFAKNDFQVYGIDIAREGIRLTKEWLKKEGLNANLKVGSIYEKLPYKNDFFDAVISTNTIHHAAIEKIRKTIQEVERVSKPKSLLFITVRRREFRTFKPHSAKIERYKKRITKYKVIGPRSYVPTEGGEKGMVHYLFNKRILRKEFKNFTIKDIWLESDERHYCMLAKLKTK